MEQKFQNVIPLEQMRLTRTANNLPCKLNGSRVASGFMLQKSSASPIFGLTARPLLAHSESSLYHGKELLFTFASGKIVSPPASTSDLFQLIICFRHVSNLWVWVGQRFCAKFDQTFKWAQIIQKNQNNIKLAHMVYLQDIVIKKNINFDFESVNGFVQSLTKHSNEHK